MDNSSAEGGLDSFDSGNKSTTPGGGEPSFRERYPEGRDRLLALAESTKCPHPQAGIAALSRRSSPFNRHSASPTCSNNSNNPTCQTPVKPKMGLKDIRNRTASRWNYFAGSPAAGPPASNVQMYSSEQSLPERLSQVIKGGLSAAFRGNGTNHNINKASASGAVAADDVVYFSSSSASASSQGGVKEEPVVRRPKSNDDFKAPVGTLSKSTENLNCRKSEMDNDDHSNSGRNVAGQNSGPPQTKLYRPQNLMKVKDCASYGMNLDDLKKLYRSLPDCSTPVNDIDDDGCEIRTGVSGIVLNDGKITGEAKETRDFGVVDSSHQQQRQMQTRVESFRNCGPQVDHSNIRSAFGSAGSKEEHRENRYVDTHQVSLANDCIHQHERYSYDQRSCLNMRASPTLRHGRQPSSDSSNSATDEVRLKITPSNAIQGQHRSSALYGIDFRDSCGSPTDSGYRSVPRNDDATADQQARLTALPPTGQQALVTNRSSHFTPVPRPTTGNPQSGDQMKSTESTTCNVLITANDTDAYNRPSAASVVPTSSPIQPQLGRRDSASRRQKVRSKHGSMHGIRMGSVPPPMHQNSAMIRHSLDDTAAAGGPAVNMNSCQPPYSGLSSPNYGTSTTSSSGASSAAAVLVASQHKSQLGPPSKVGTSISPQHQQCAVNGASFDTINTNVSLPEEFSLERCPKLVELDRAPWNEKDIVAVLQKGRTKTLVNQIAIDVVPRLTYLLQRPLIRIAREVQRLCQRFGKCTKSDMHYAAKIILPTVLGDSCQKAALRATAMFIMSGETLKQSKSQRAGLIGLSVGKFQRWMCDAQLSLCVLDQATVYLTAVMENLLEEIVLQSVPDDGDMLTSDYLDVALANNVELWGLLQPYSHLICSRTANGLLGLPKTSIFTSSGERPNKSHSRQLSLNQQPSNCRLHDRNGGCGNNGTMVKNLEQCLLATCVGNAHELGELVNRVVHHQIGNSTPSLSALGCGNAGSASAGRQSTLLWSKAAVRTLFYFMRCSQLEHADNPHSTPPSVVLGHERPYLVLPPLIEWLRVSQAHTEHRQGCVVDSNDVLQAARVLLPGIDCPPRPFGLEDDLPISGNSSPHVCNQRLRSNLAYRMLTSGIADQVHEAVSLLDVHKLSAPNDHGLTPLMWACYQNDESAVRVLLDGGAEVNNCVPSFSSASQHKANLVLPELAGWTALTFAVAQRTYPLAGFLLEKGAAAELPEMCTETPLQIAAMMGHHDLVNLLMSKGADPYHSTVSPDAGFKQRGCSSPLSLAGSHGHRTVLQAMLTRRRGRSEEEVLSLEDFLAEGVQSPPGKDSQTNGRKPSQANSQQPGQSTSWLGKLTKSQQKMLQETMYQAAECGHLDITMDLRHLGIPWNTYIWTQTLSTAHELRRKALVQLLLSEFMKHHLDELNQEFIDECLPLLFEIFRQSKNEVSTGQLAEILSYLYGEEPIPPVGGSLSQSTGLDENPMAPRIDAKYVNNPDLSDVQFLVEGRVFYGHKIVLINASERFKRLLHDGSTTVEVNGVQYEIFRMLMEFLYNGKPTAEGVNDLSVLSQLLCAANDFGLQTLRLHCAVMISRSVVIENCIDIYQFAVHNESNPLMRYCEGYFLQNLPTLINRVDGYRRLMMCNHAATANTSLLVSSSSPDMNKSSSDYNTSAGNTFDMADALLQILTDRLQQRMQTCKRV